MASVMRQMNLEEYRDTYFTPRSRPSVQKLRYMCQRGRLPAHKIGGIWYIDADSLPERQVSRLVNKILSA